MEKVFVRSAYNYDRDKESELSGLSCGDPSRAQQQFAEECDINTIVRRFGLTGQMPVGLRVPSYSDFEGVFDFHSAMNAVNTARESFYSMPAHVRARFHNDPQDFLEFCHDEANRDEAVKLGLVVEKAATLVAPTGAPGSPVADGDASAAPAPVSPPGKPSGKG